MYYQKYSQKSLNTENEVVFDTSWMDDEWRNSHLKKESISWISQHVTKTHLKDMEFMALPAFRAIRTSPETEHLKKHYLKAREHILEHFKGKDILETTLRILVS